MTYYCALIWLILSWSSLSPTFYRNFKVLNICVVPQCQWDKVQSLLISHNILQDLQPCDLSLATHLLHPSNFSLVPLIFDTSAVVIISLSIDLATPLSTHIFFLSYVFTSQGITGDGWQMIASTAIFISYTFYFLPENTLPWNSLMDLLQTTQVLTYKFESIWVTHCLVNSGWWSCD